MHTDARRLPTAPAFTRGLVAFALSLATSGCELQPPTHSAAVRAAVTKSDPALATPDYWWGRPPVASADAADFQRAWEACRAELRGRLFRVDREEYRLGLMSSEPMTSKQGFEPWRSDAVTAHDVDESTLATIRRTVRFEVAKTDGGGYRVVPKVLVERFASAERRLTAISQYHQAFSGPRAFADTADQSGTGLAENAPGEYWYALHRDPELERDLATSIAGRLRG